MSFRQKLKQAWENNNSLVCVGLDPDMHRLPEGLSRDKTGLLEFCTSIIDATADLVCAFKPQIAYFAALSAEDVLLKTMDYIRDNYPDVPIILDAKRSDIGSTAKQYALEAFQRFGADAVTVNPYLGGDALAPFLEHADKGVILLCRTSNPGAAEIQDLEIEGEPLFLRVAEKAANEWNYNSNCALVVGATWPNQLRRVREIAGNMPILVPGVGAQGGSAAEVVNNGTDADGAGLIINSSRGVIYASQRTDFPDAARQEAKKLRDLVNQARV
ncbi:MAG: orotidine-5'-phosphate decarboxylase [Pseudomonadota bacterium]